MSTVQPFPAGGYRFITHQFQYSGGVASELGFRIERARFTRPAALAVAFDEPRRVLATNCACGEDSVTPNFDADRCQQRPELRKIE